MAAADPKPLHLVMFPFFAFGHISPFVNLSNKLITSHSLQITFFSAPANVPRIKPSLHPSAQIVPLQLPHVDGLPPGAESTSDLPPHLSGLLTLAMDRLQPQVRRLLDQLKPHFVLFDFAQEWLPELANDLGIKTCFFSVFVALSTAFLTVPARRPDSAATPSLDQMKLPPLGFPETSCIKSVPEYQARDFMILFRTSSDENGKKKPCLYDRVVSGLKNCSVIVAKTCNEMERPYIDYVKSQFQKPLLLTGPLLPSKPSIPLDEKWETWLSQFSPKSVVFCSFGSETFLTSDQITELVLGLELTSLPFLLILNSPNGGDSLSSLPLGFLDRVKGRGVISTGWVQQAQILGHASVGCYVNHGGFSSIIEAVTNDCQLVMMPQKGDQFLNARLVSGDWGAGVEVERDEEGGGFDREGVRKGVETVMVRVMEEPGKTIRERHGKWRDVLTDPGFERRLILDFVNELETLARI